MLHKVIKNNYFSFFIMNENDVLLNTLQGGYRERRLPGPLNAMEVEGRCRAISRRNNQQRCRVKILPGERFCYQHLKSAPFAAYEHEGNIPVRRKTTRLVQGITTHFFNTNFIHRYILRHIKSSCRKHQIPLTTSIKKARVVPFQRDANPFICFFTTYFTAPGERERKIIPFVITNKFFDNPPHAFNATIFLPFFCPNVAQYNIFLRTVLDFLTQICVRQDLAQIFNCETGNLRNNNVTPNLRINRFVCQVYTMNYFQYIDESRYCAYMLALVKSLSRIKTREALPQAAAFARLTWIDEENLVRKLRELDFLFMSLSFHDNENPPGPIYFDFTVNYDGNPRINFVPDVLNMFNIAHSQQRWRALAANNGWIRENIRPVNMRADEIGVEEEFDNILQDDDDDQQQNLNNENINVQVNLGVQAQDLRDPPVQQFLQVAANDDNDIANAGDDFFIQLEEEMRRLIDPTDLGNQPQQTQQAAIAQVDLGQDIEVDVQDVDLVNFLDPDRILDYFNNLDRRQN